MGDMNDHEAVAAFRAEASRLSKVIGSLSDADLDRPTPCPPWTVRDLVAHVIAGAARPAAGLAVPEPDGVDCDAVSYFAPRIFTAEGNAERVTSAQRAAATYATAAALAATFDDTWRRTDAAVRRQPPGRRTVTRHGDGILLTEFMVTRVVELALHGLDLAAALDVPPWTTADASAVVLGVLLIEGRDKAALLGWDEHTMLAKGSGRVPLTPDEQDAVERLGIRRLTLG